MTHCLITGASGFIGGHLAKHLSDSDHRITCLVRRSSDRSSLAPFEPRFVEGDLSDRESIRSALRDVDVVYHLAGVTRNLNKRQLQRGNERGVKNVAACCAEMDQPPVLVSTSSLAAAGPSETYVARTESEPLNPVSNYGHSKLAGELAAREHALRVPTTIVRPPCVFGERDRNGLLLFECIAKWGVHLVPGIQQFNFSAIHAADLAVAMVLLADRGHRISPHSDDDQGIYFATAEETPTYADFGRMIGQVMGCRKTRVLHIPKMMIWATAAINELTAQVLRKPRLMNLDKAREATAGSWTCSAKALERDTGFATAKPLRQRLQQTSDWYLENGWLKHY